MNPIIGDLFLGADGDIKVVDNNDLKHMVAQAIRTALLLFQGTWFLDLTQGVPWLQSILGQKIPVTFVAAILRTAVLKIPGIASLDSFNCVEVQPRGVQLVFSLTVTDGTKLTSSDFAPFVIGAAASNAGGT